MKIAFLHNSALTFYPMRGELVQCIRQRGHEVIACLPDHMPGAKEKLAALGIPTAFFKLQPAGMNPLREWQYLRSLQIFFDQYKPDLVFSTTIKPMVFGAIAAGRSKAKPLISSMVTGLGYAFSPRSLLDFLISPAIHFLYRKALRKNSVIFFQNPDDLALFEGKRLINKNQKSVLINGSGVNLKQFHVARFPKERMRFLFVGRLVKDKGVGEFVDAARILKKRYPNVEFQLVGYLDPHPTGVTPNELTQWIDEGIIDYQGATDDVRPYLEGASVFVLPSYREGTSRATLEAMAMGRPIITTDAPGCRETVKEGENGFLVPVRDAHAVAAAMEKFIMNPELISPMGRKSRERAESRFDMAQVNSKIIEALGL